MTEQKENRKDILVVKDISIVNGKYRYTTEEIKLLTIFIAMLKKNSDKIEDVVISLKDLSRLTGTIKNHKQLRNVCDRLQSRTLEIKNGYSWKKFNWFHVLEYHHEKGLIRAIFHDELKPFLSQLKERYVLYELENILRLRSFYSIRLYELLKEYLKIGSREFTILTLRMLLGIEGKLLKWIDLKRNVIDLAVEDINENTNLKIGYEIRKFGRKVHSIIFNVKEKMQVKSENSNIDEYDNYLSIIPERYMEYRDEIVKILERYKDLDSEVIISNINLAIMRSPENFYGFLMSALKNDYAKNIREMMKKKALEEQMRKELEEKKKREKEEKAKKEEELFQKKLEIYEQMTEEQKEILLQTARDRFKLVKSEELLFMMAIQSIEVKEES